MSNLRFRNLTVTPADPVADWGVEGLLAAVDRGSLPDWRRIADAVRAEPWGPFTTQLLQALELAEDRGVTATLQRVVARAREEVEQSAREEVRYRLSALVAESGLTAAEFAARLGTSPSRLSTYLSGKVVPSAALVVRAEGVADRAKDRVIGGQPAVDQSPDTPMPSLISSLRSVGRLSPMTLDGSPSIPSTNQPPKPSRVKPPATPSGSPLAT